MLSLKERLTDILINHKLLSSKQLDQALKLQKDKGGRLSDIIVELKFMKESDLISVLSQGLGFPLIDLKRFKINSEIVALLPADIARHYQIIPVSKMEDTITLAMADPLNIFAIDHVQLFTGFKINPIISSANELLQTIELYYPDATGGVIDNIVKEMATSSIELVKEKTEALPSDQELSCSIKEPPVIKVTNMIVREGVKKNASDILIEPLEKKLRIRFRIDGVLKEQMAPPKKIHPMIVSRIKVMSDLNIAEHRLPQDGRFKADLFDREIDFRVSILPSSFGEKVAIRILDKSQALLDIGKLGFDQDFVAKIKKLSKLPHGMVVVCGPTGAGKTTTLYSLLKFTDSPEKNIVTVEDPVEFQLEGINQVSAKPDIGLTFASALRSILRQDPNIIMIGEIRDYETVDIAIKSALTGHLVLSTLHTTTAPGAIIRLINMGVEPFLINSSLICVVAQRLLRKVCDSCKEKYTLKKEVISSWKIKTSKAEFYRGHGCPKCLNSGYSSRIGIAELLVLTPRVREMILNRNQEHQIKALARKEGMKTLREEGLAAAEKGLTTLEEVIRVTVPDE